MKIDKDIVFLYSENARLKIKAVAAALKTTPQRLKYSLSTLERESILMQPHCVFDYSFFGLLLFRVYFKGAYASENDKVEILKRLSANEYVVSIDELSGEFDLVIEMLCPNPSRFNKQIRRIIDDMPTLANHKMVLNIVTHIYPRSYLVGRVGLSGSAPSQIIIGGDRDLMVFSQKEMSLLMNLFQNPQIRMTSLARSSAINVRTAKTMFREMTSRRIVRGFRFLIDMERLGVFCHRLFLKLHNHTDERDEQLLSFLLATPEVICLNRTVGDWNMEIDIESLDKGRIRSLVMQIREQFKDVIENFNRIEVYQHFKKTYLPRYYFAQEAQRI